MKKKIEREGKGEGAGVVLNCLVCSCDELKLKIISINEVSSSVEEELERS